MLPMKRILFINVESVYIYSIRVIRVL